MVIFLPNQQQIFMSRIFVALVDAIVMVGRNIVAQYLQRIRTLLFPLQFFYYCFLVGTSSYITAYGGKISQIAPQQADRMKYV